MRKIIISCLLSLVVSFVADGRQLKLPTVIGSGMVLQQNENVNIWGWADPSAKITVKAQWLADEQYAVADADGNWRVTLSTPSGSYDKYTMSVSDENTVINLEDILIGEVWLCSGQSNMAWKVGQVLDLKKEQKNAATLGANVRLYSTGRISSEHAQDDVADASWNKCTPETVVDFSAVGYGFGLELQQGLDVPVGLIQASYGGTYLEGWVSPDAIQNGEKAAFLQRSVGLVNKRKSGKWIGQESQLWNANIHPILNTRIAGVIWYQGCSNVAVNPVSYRETLQGLISSWRKEFNNPELPFYIAQIAPHTYDNVQGALLRESQAFVAEAVQNCELVVTNDCQEIPGDIHPRLKKKICHRLALCALGQHYKKDVGSWRSPAFSHVEQNGKELKVYFKNLQTILMVQGDKPIGFQIGSKGEGGIVKYVLADARLDESGKCVILSSKSMNAPTDARYCFDESVGNVFSAEGLPLAPFRTDLKNKPLSMSARAYVEPAVKTPITFKGSGYKKVKLKKGAKFWTNSEMTLFDGSYPKEFEGFEMLIAEGVDKGEKSNGGKFIAKTDGRIYYISNMNSAAKKSWYKPGWKVIIPSKMELRRQVGESSEGKPKYKTIGSIYISYLDVKAGQEVDLITTDSWTSVIPLASSIEYIDVK